MIVLYGRDDDPPLSMVKAALAEQETPFLFVDQCALHEYGILLEVSDRGLTGHIQCPGADVPLCGISAI